MDQSADVSRRALLRGVAGATAASTAAGTAAAQEDGEGGGGGGTATAGAAGTATAQEDGEGGGGGGGNERPVFPSYVDGAKGGDYQDMRGSSAVTVEVGAGSEGLAFSPTNIWVDAGTEVTFEWVSDGHNVLPESQPEGAGWEGSGSALEDSGFTYSFPFETGGMYTYFCQPHEDLGMKGAIAVGPDVETEQVGGGGGGGPDVPDAAKSLGVAAGFAMAATLGLAYFFIKYGGNYGESSTTEG
jgi:halocyanin-like protein